MVRLELNKLRKLQELGRTTEAEKKKRDREQWQEWLTRYRARLEQEIQDMSEEKATQIATARVKLMNENNPRVILRNYIVQAAIEKAESGDFSEVRALLELLREPYVENHHLNADGRYSMAPPQAASKIRVT
eukprot:TRINITY_DN11945_c0_g1_i1.p1 TRINITY_DN11945_c0_g1~~TRINITY_DN11945_c0_g1_i1.p1  ORF type:complete len:132 (+),score=26.82 TRINITY_DN11945_c0_g1_i1:44-439(+)